TKYPGWAFLSDQLSAEVRPAVAVLGLLPPAMRLGPAGTKQMDDVVAARGEELGDQPPVASDPERLGAHQARRGLGERFLEPLLPRLGPHSRRVAPERRHADAAEAILTRLSTQASAELDGVPVGDPGRVERRLERVAAELRVPPRPREAAHVDERLHA